MIDASEDKPLDRIPNKYAGIKGTFRLSVWVPTETVGKVIGKKGVVITHIQRTTQTEVVVLPVSPEKDPLWSPLSISGEPAKVLNAYNTIRDIVEETDDVVGEFPLPRQKIYHGLFYGNHHEAVKRLSADTNVRINVPDGNFGAASSHITLEGPAGGVFRALEKFEEVLSDRSYSTYKSVTPPLKLEDGMYQYVVKVPVSIVGLLLVRRGTDSNVLYQIRSATRTHIIKHTDDAVKDGVEDDEHVGVVEAGEGDAGAGGEEEPTPRRGQRRPNSSSHETFAVRGSKEEDVVLAATSLSRIIDGEKIFSVMHDLRLQRPSSFDRPYNTHDTDSGGRHAGGRGRGDGRGGRGGSGRGRGRIDDSASDDGRWGRMRLTSEDSSSRGVGAPSTPTSSKPSSKGSKKAVGADAEAAVASTDGADATDDNSESAASRDRRESSRGSGRRGSRAGRGSGSAVSSEKKRTNSRDRVNGTGGGGGRGGRGGSGRGGRPGRKGKGEHMMQTEDGASSL